MNLTGMRDSIPFLLAKVDDIFEDSSELNGVDPKHVSMLKKNKVLPNPFENRQNGPKMA